MERTRSAGPASRASRPARTAPSRLPPPVSLPPEARALRLAPRRRRRRRSRRLEALVIAAGLSLVLLAVAARRPWWHASPAASPPPAASAPAPDAGSGAPRSTPPARGAASVRRPDPALQALVESLIDRDNGATAVAVWDLRTGASAAYHEDDVFPAASLAKVPILVETFRAIEAGALRPDEALTVTADAITGGAGVLQGRAGDRLTVTELALLAVTVSDNVAARLLLQRVGGVEAVNRTLGALGLHQTRLYADDRPNTTTAAEMATLMAWIAGTERGALVASAGGAGAPSNGSWTTSTAAGAPRSAGAPDAATGAPRGAGLPDAAAGAPGALPERAPAALADLLSLPQAQSWIRERLPRSATVAHKSGQLPGLRHEAAVLYTPRGPIVVVGLTSDLADQDAAESFLARLGREVYDHLAEAALR